MRLTTVPQPLRSAVAVAVALGIFYASIITPPSSGVPELLLGIPFDKWLHAAAYAALAGAVGFALLARDARALALVCLLAAGYGAGIEVVQSFLPARAFDPLDMLANAIGAGIGTAAWWLLLRRAANAGDPKALSASTGKRGQ